MGLSGCNEAVRDCDLKTATCGKPRGYFSKISNQMTNFFDPIVKADYLA